MMSQYFNIYEVNYEYKRVGICDISRENIVLALIQLELSYRVVII